MRFITSLLLLSVMLSQCKVNNTQSKSSSKQATSAQKNKRDKEYPYQPSAPKVFDLEHTRLELSFNYKERWVLGRATIALHSHFYATDTLRLDARKFTLHQVASINGYDTTKLKYNYDGNTILIYLPRKYKGGETFYIYIHYTAHPEQVDQAGSAAIKGAQGLYFINPERSDPSKPREIWSQGETQSNSGWFPTLDVPNQKMTQEIFLTVDQDDVTLSNGELILSKDNPDGTRTDQWKQSLPHAPYLTMIAIGPFDIVKDYWRNNMEVNYYVEKAFKPYAKLIFGHTPEMLELFSKKLGVDYPWEKFDQIVVRDFVSGAMENTTAVIHSEPLQHDAREHLDQTYEDVISHELFHHWFGDLVTCESWSNVPLNESFATYGEYIWNEYKYGRMYADKALDDMLSGYLMGTHNYTRLPIRYRYNNREDMFDAVSYQKGGRILHMLRYTVGDDAFFKSLQLYLTNRKFKTAEIHDLRLAFEEVTGQDMNWFFDQWFLKSGHPILDITYQPSADQKNMRVIVKQTQDSIRAKPYYLPLKMDMYTNGQVKRESILLSHTTDTFNFTSSSSIQLINMDADKILVGEVNYHLSREALTFQFLNAPLYADKWFALKNYTGNADTVQQVDSNLLVMADFALEHKSESIRALGLEILRGANNRQLRYYEFRLRQMAKNDPISFIRAGIVELLSKYDAGAFEPLFTSMLNDSSYKVVAAALVALNHADPLRAVKAATNLEPTKNGQLLSAISTVYSSSSDSTLARFFIPAILKAPAYRFSILQDYWEYLMMQMPLNQLKGIDEVILFLKVTEDNKGLMNLCSSLASQMKLQNAEFSHALEDLLKKQKKDSEQAINIQRGLDDLKKVDEKLNEFLK